MPDPSDIQAAAPSVDRSDMATVIQGTGGQIDYAVSDPDFPSTPSGPFEAALVVGMGGSALPADVLNDGFREALRVPVAVCRDYALPRGIDERTLLIFCSFSGNTEEVLEAASGVAPGAANVVVVTAGGKLEAMGGERGYPVVKIPAHREPASFQPRCATGYFVTYLARVLHAGGLLADPTAGLRKLAAFLGQQDLREEGERLATWLADRHPLFYTDQSHESSVARIAKIKFNENAKRPGFFNAIPESNHNEMIGFSKASGSFGVLYFRDEASHPRVHQRFEVTERLVTALPDTDISFRQWTMVGEDRLQRVFASLMLADWISYAAAVMGGVDPTPVELVEAFKGVLASEPPPTA
jgi:glucose/mannose-6-phosphate isomerase